MSREHKTLLIRADASAQIGAGHVMRCLALAQAWQAGGGRAMFLSHCEGEALRRRIEAAGVVFLPLDKIHPAPADLRRTLALLEELHANWLVLDGYHFEASYQQAVRAAGCRLLVIDDYAHQPEYHTDILLNQNIDASQLRYVCNPDTRLLLGTRFALLRAEFLAWRGWRRDVPAIARKVLITLGGGDPDNVTLKVIRALRHVDVTGLEANIVVGPINPHLETLRKAVEQTGGSLRLMTDAADMPALMAWADAAVAAGGSTCWELAFMGLPCILLSVAENQQGIAPELHRLGVAVYAGEGAGLRGDALAKTVTSLAGSRNARMAMAAQGQSLVDGWGVDRVLMNMRGEPIRLRPATSADARLLWGWANERTTRAASFSSDPIPWAHHVPWFEEKLKDPNCQFWIAINGDDVPVGQVRIDVDGSEAVISVGLDANFRGRGYGSVMIRKTAENLFRVSEAKAIHAYIKPGNEASVGAFHKVGFRKMGMTQVRDQAAVDFILFRDGKA